MNTRIPLGKPYLNNKDILFEIEKALDTKWISGGPTVSKFEDAVKSYIGGGHPVAVSNGTIAIDLALLKLNSGKRYNTLDEVIVPTWSWVATGFSPVNVGATPVWCDVNDFGVVEASEIESKITKNTKAIIVVHQMGIPCDMDKINELSKKYNIPIVEDAACGFGSEYKNVRIGNSQNLVTFSLQARKCLTTGEGGFVIARDEEEANWFKCMRAFGTSVNPLERDKAQFLLKEKFVFIGSNYKISDITAAVGLAQLKNFDEEVILRSQAGNFYNELVSNKLKDYATVANVVPNYCTRYNWQNYHILLKDNIDRDKVVDQLRKRGIGSKWDIQCIHLEPAFGNSYENVRVPTSMKFHDHGLWLPFFAEITKEEQEYVIDTVKYIIEIHRA